MKKQQKRIQGFTFIVLGVLALGLFASVFGLSKVVKYISGTSIARTPEVVLANVGVSKNDSVNLPVAYFDQKSDKCVNLYDMSLKQELRSRQFEWKSCGYENKGIEQGMVDYYLGENNLPVALGGKLTSNRGLSDMKRWFSTVEGKSQEYTKTIKLSYKDEFGADFSYHNNDFYPLDDVKFSAGDSVNSDGHNHLFTMNFAIPFTAMLNGEENFEITADDDTFVYFGNALVLDMGGIHDAVSGKIAINENGEVYTSVADEELGYSGINIEKGDNGIIRIFHADRDSDESVFQLKTHEMKLNVIKTKVAGGDTETQIAYNPSDPLYVAPLGETSVFRPDGTRGYIIMMTIAGGLIVVFSLFIAMLMNLEIRKRR